MYFLFILLILFYSLLDIVDELHFCDIVLMFRLKLLFEVFEVFESGLHFCYF